MSPNPTSMRQLLITLSLSLSFVAKASDNSQITHLHDQAYSLLSSDLDSAMLIADSSLSLAIDANLHWEIANSYYIKAYILDEQNKLSQALYMYLKASDALSNISADTDPKISANILLNSGIILGKYYHYDEAIKYYDQGLEQTDSTPSYQRLKLLYGKAYHLRRQGEYISALEVLKEASNLAIDLERPSFLLKCYNLLGLLHRENNFLEEAKSYFDHILADPQSSIKNKGLAYNNLALLHYDAGDIDLSKYYFDKAIFYTEQLNDKKPLFNSYQGLCASHLEINDLIAAEKFALKCEELYPSLTNDPETYSVFFYLDTINYLKNEINKSQFYSSKYRQASLQFIEDREDIIKQSKKFQMSLLISGFEAEQKANDQRKKSTLYQWLAISGVFLIIVLLITFKIWFKWWRKDLWKGVNEILTR